MIRDIVDSGISRTQAIASWHTDAMNQIGAAEYALNRLISDCNAVMCVPQARASTEVVAPQAVTAIPEPLAA